MFVAIVSPKIWTKNCQEFLLVVCRVEILTIFHSYFGRNDDFINSFWNLLKFTSYYLHSSLMRHFLLTQIKSNIVCLNFHAQNTVDQNLLIIQCTALKLRSYSHLSEFLYESTFSRAQNQSWKFDIPPAVSLK